MFKHLLVTLDGTPRAETVIPHAVDIARTMGAEISLLRVVEAVNSDWSERGAIGKGQEAESTIRTMFTEQAESYLARLTEEVRRAGIGANAVVRQGPPARTIVGYAHESSADAIAMATHSRRGLNRLMFGSVAEYVLHESSLPVLLVRAP